MNGDQDPSREGLPDPTLVARKGMVEWYHPTQLLLTALQVMVWDFVGQGRSMEESPRSWKIHRFGRREVWFDFAADVGDGWNPAFAIASLIALPSLEAAGRPLRHGDFLLLGGDQVYPVPTQSEYRDRFVEPYTQALRDSPGSRALLAIPGNHDWYDGLVSFSRQFTQGRQIGNWHTIQEQSYFALKLPHRWWLWALDVRTGSHMDFGQRSYFYAAARKLKPGDRVILVAAEPDWVTRDPRDREESHYLTVERDFIAPRKAAVHLWLAGDRHHYRRHELRDLDGTTDRNFQRITSGGGGAFLFPTHRPVRSNVVVRRCVARDGKPEVEEHEFVQKTRFPSGVTSFRLSWLNLLFAVKNWKLGLFPMGVLYWLLTWVTLPPDWPAPSSWRIFLGSPGMLLWLLTILFFFGVFADREKAWFRWIGGLAHGLAHVITAIGVTGIVNASFLAGAASLTDTLAAHVLNFLAGVVFGPTVFGLYLLLSMNLFGFHSLEAFSSLRIQDYKHFLRLHIDRHGRLEIFPLAIHKAPRVGVGRGRYMLIEEPIVIDPHRREEKKAERVKPAVNLDSRA
ncbi:MAG TPA: hypothetical protein VFU96_03700 [Acidimicrobiia bacterium]|nr:hypothetical protein [Acidimicrobiia bacterium]